MVGRPQTIFTLPHNKMRVYVNSVKLQNLDYLTRPCVKIISEVLANSRPKRYSHMKCVLWYPLTKLYEAKEENLTIQREG